MDKKMYPKLKKRNNVQLEGDMEKLGPLMSREIDGVRQSFHLLRADGSIVAVLGLCRRREETESQLAAKAKLFAAAPELLNALEYMVGAYGKWDTAIVHRARVAISNAVA